MVYTFDGSYYGFLTAIFETFDRNDEDVYLTLQNNYQPTFFDSSYDVQTDDIKAKRVQEGIVKFVGNEKAYECFKIFQHENLQTINSLYNVIIKMFRGEKNIWDNYGDIDVMNCSLANKQVRREAHRMKAFIRFQKSEDGMFFTEIEPDFNVLPLIIKFFKNRYSDQQWLIFDKRRKYGMFYNMVSVKAVTFSDIITNSKELPSVKVEIDEKEEKYQNLWKAYFNSTNIIERKNLKLHIQYVPKRYWKYLTEK